LENYKLVGSSESGALVPQGWSRTQAPLQLSSPGVTLIQAHPPPHILVNAKEDLEGKHPMDMAGKSSLSLTAHWPELSHMAFLWPQVRLGNEVSSLAAVCTCETQGFHH